MDKEDNFERKMRVFEILPQVPDDKLKELKHFLRNQIRKELCRGQLLQDKSQRIINNDYEGA